MDLTNRGHRFQTSSEDSEVKQPGLPSHKKNNKSSQRNMLLKIFQVGLLVAITVLIAGLLLSIATYKKNQEDNYVDTSKYQAVFLNGGQVYFGKIADLNKNNLVLSNIYYLRIDRQVQPDKTGQQQNNFTLAKLGCELHRPTDVMVINKDQVVFWENLKDESAENTVPGAIKKYVETTNGTQNCDQQSGSSGGTTTDNSSNSSSGSSTTDTSSSDNSTSTTKNNQ